LHFSWYSDVRNLRWLKGAVSAPDRRQRRLKIQHAVAYSIVAYSIVAYSISGWRSLSRSGVSVVISKFQGGEFVPLCIAGNNSPGHLTAG
jgi:hypothetical protein